MHKHDTLRVLRFQWTCPQDNAHTGNTNCSCRACIGAPKVLILVLSGIHPATLNRPPAVNRWCRQTSHGPPLALPTLWYAIHCVFAVAFYPSPFLFLTRLLYTFPFPILFPSPFPLPTLPPFPNPFPTLFPPPDPCPTSCVSLLLCFFQPTRSVLDAKSRLPE